MVGEGATARGLSDPKAPRASGTPVDRARKLLSSEEGPPQRARCKVQGARCPDKRAGERALELAMVQSVSGSTGRKGDSRGGATGVERCGLQLNRCYTFDGRSAEKESVDKI